MYIIGVLIVVNKSVVFFYNLGSIYLSNLNGCKDSVCGFKSLFIFKLIGGWVDLFKDFFSLSI